MQVMKYAIAPDRAAGKTGAAQHKRRSRALSFQVESDSALKSLILNMILSEKSATFRDHALMSPQVVRRRNRAMLITEEFLPAAK
jgi:hypothetical protein